MSPRLSRNPNSLRFVRQGGWKKHSTIQDFSIMYEPLLTCLDAIACTEQGWDTKTFACSAFLCAVTSAEEECPLV